MHRFSLLPSPDRARPAPSQAWDKIFRRFAAIKRFPEGLTIASTGRELFSAWERWLTAPHPGLLRPATIDFSLGWMVREWIEGFTLVDFLRHRRKLPGRECFRLLQTLPPVLDHAHQHGMLSEIDLDKIYVHFPTVEERRSVAFLSTPIEQWPLWALRVEPMRISRYAPRSEHFTDCDRYPYLAGDLTPAQVLHRLLRELAGGGISRASTPLAAFGDSVNQLLCQSPDPKAFPAAAGYFRELLESDPASTALSTPVELRSSRPYLRTPAFPGEGTPGELLHLEPISGKSRAIRIIGHEELRLGRSLEQADVTVLFPGESAEAIEKTKCLGRVHARLRSAPGEIRVYDGSAEAPSRNGTFLSAGPASHTDGVVLRGMSALQLGPHWRGSLTPVGMPRQTLVGEAAVTSRSRSDDWGAVFISPWQGSTLLTESVWLLEEAGFAFEADGGLVWDTEVLDTAPAAFRREGTGFILVNYKWNTPDLIVDGQRVPKECGVPLRDGQCLQMVSAQWRVHIR